MSFKTDYEFGRVEFLQPASKDDMEHGVDGWLAGIPIAYRKRRISLKDYGEISIRYRRANGAKTEYQKLLAGEYKSLIYFFHFTDALVICAVSDILATLKRGLFKEQNNYDGTFAAYIKIEDIKHFHLEV